MERIKRCRGFEWDAGNADKNWLRHRVTQAECEQLFFNRPLVVGDDPHRSFEEPRFYVLGTTDAGRRLFVVATVRGGRLRVISARDMSRKERKVFENAQDSQV